MARRSGGSVIGRFFYLVFLFAIIFASIYGAFYLNNKKEVKKQQQKNIQIHEYFISETKTIENQLSKLHVLDTTIDGFLKSYKKLEMPEISGFHVPFTYHMGGGNLWEAVLHSDAAEVMKFETVKQIDELMNLRTALAETIKQGNAYQKDLVLPNMDKGKYEFYEFRTKELKPKYKWFLSYLSNLQAQIKEFRKLNSALTQYLTSELNALNDEEETEEDEAANT